MNNILCNILRQQIDELLNLVRERTQTPCVVFEERLSNLYESTEAVITSACSPSTENTTLIIFEDLKEHIELLSNDIYWKDDSQFVELKYESLGFDIELELEELLYKFRNAMIRQFAIAAEESTAVAALLPESDQHSIDRVLHKLLQELAECSEPAFTEEQLEYLDHRIFAIHLEVKGGTFSCEDTLHHQPHHPTTKGESL